MLATAGGADIASYVGVPPVALRPLAPWVRGLSLQIRQRHGSVEQVRATFGFRSRHFVASNPIYILLDICRLGLYTNAVLLRVAVMFARMSPPKINPPCSIKEVRRAEFRCQHSRGENPGFMQRREDSGCEALIVAGHQHADQRQKRAAAQKRC